MQIGVADELRNRKHTDEQALRKYEELIKQLEKNYENAKKELDKLNKTKEEHLKKTKEDEKQLEKYREQLERARDDARKSLEAMKEAQKNVSSEKYQLTYKKIRTKFPMLSADALAFFATAEQFYVAFDDNESVDYSVIIVEYCKVLEVSLWNYLSKSEEYRIEVSNCLKAKRGKTLGSAAHITAEDKKKSLGKYNEDIFEFSRLRNAGAHKGRLGKTKIEKVKTFLWTSDILTDLTNQR